MSSLAAGAASIAQLTDRTNRIAKDVACIKIAFERCPLAFVAIYDLAKHFPATLLHEARLPRKSRLICRGRGLDHKPPQRDEILLTRGGAPKGETDCPARLGRSKTQQFDPFIPHFGIGRNLWQERDAMAVGDHLHDGRETGRAEAQRHVELHG